MLGEASLLSGRSSMEINPTALVRIVQMIWLANETKADNAQAKLSVWSGLREKNDRFKVRFLVWFENKDLKGIHSWTVHYPSIFQRTQKKKRAKRARSMRGWGREGGWTEPTSLPFRADAQFSRDSIRRSMIE